MFRKKRTGNRRERIKEKKDKEPVSQVSTIVRESKMRI